jgi:hypothetical protein
MVAIRRCNDYQLLLGGARENRIGVGWNSRALFPSLGLVAAVDRTFSYSFDPLNGCPIGKNIARLSVSEIENAALLEVLQTPGASLGSWAILDALLAQTGPGTPFVFKEPLGQAREVKVALSGLFGRFVARAYLERYFNLSAFAHLGSRTIRLDGRRRVRVRRKANMRGDLPDWVASDRSLTKLFIAEAKGCHDRTGPAQALGRAWLQANRINLVGRGGRIASVKRIAIATRWGVAIGASSAPMLAVRDPEEEGNMTAAETEAAHVGVTRLSAANLLKGLGHLEFSEALVSLVDARDDQAVDEVRQHALSLLDAAKMQEPLSSDPNGPHDSMIGSWVTRAGIAHSGILSDADQEVLNRLNLRPVFVGIERAAAKRAIEGDLAESKEREGSRITEGPARTDGSGTWILRKSE